MSDFSKKIQINSHLTLFLYGTLYTSVCYATFLLLLRASGDVCNSLLCVGMNATHAETICVCPAGISDLSG